MFGHWPHRQVPLVPSAQGEDGGGRTLKMGSTRPESIRETWTPTFAPLAFIFDVFFSRSSPYCTECCLWGSEATPSQTVTSTLEDN